MRKFLLSLVALVGLSTAAAVANYAMTQGAGTTFGSTIVGGVHYVQMFLCDLTTPGQCASVSAGGAVKVDGSAVTQPVSGTVTAAQATAANLNATVVGTGTFAVQAAQSGTWTVQPGNTANTTPWLVTGSGTAGSAAAGVLSVQGIASMTPLFITSATAPVSTMNSASSSAGVTSPIAGVFDDVSPTAITENNFGFLRMSANRNLYGTIRDAAGNERGANVNASNQLNITGPVTMVSGAVASGAYASGAIASGAYASGAFASGAFASGSVASGAMVDLGAQADAACGSATGTCSLIALTKYLNTAANSAIPAGTNLIGDVNLRQGGTALSTTNGIYSNLLQGNAVLSATNGLYFNQLQGNAVLSITNPIFNRPVAGATGGASTTGNIAANNTTAVVIKGSAGTLYGVQLAGLGSAPAYLKIYNATSATCGSGTPVKRLMIPAASTAANGAGSNITFGAAGIDFSTGITYCVTTGIGDSDTTAPAASTFLINIDYK